MRLSFTGIQRLGIGSLVGLMALVAALPFVATTRNLQAARQLERLNHIQNQFENIAHAFAEAGVTFFGSVTIGKQEVLGLCSKLDQIRVHASVLGSLLPPGDQRAYLATIVEEERRFRTAIYAFAAGSPDDPARDLAAAATREIRNTITTSISEATAFRQRAADEHNETSRQIVASLRRAAVLMSAGGACIASLAIAISVVLTRALARPLRQILGATHAIGEGDFSVRVNLPDSDIVGELGQGVDHMAERIETERAALEDAKRQAEEATRAKGEFLANMSHEIRTPMTAILGFADSLVDESLPLQERREAVETIRRSGEHLLQVINDVLDLSKIEAGKLIVELVDCPTCSILAEVQSFMAPKAASKQLALDVEFLTPIPERIRTDPVRLRQILLNLVGNSLKFTESGGVRLVIRHVSEPVSALQLDIVDTGIGMNPEQAASIFNAFQQADASTTRRFGGTGLEKR